ncbi:MAG: MgtC/SapB family protein [Geobacteraceae bacterium]|nr:MgtC/SapB family protein [Geobacteraceae bacterium]
MEFDFHVALRLLLAALLGGVIGLEREIHGRPAGFRTHLLVSLGSCVFAVISVSLYRMYGDFTGRIPVGVDPARVAAQVVTGIGFLGAGAILRDKASIRGLTTAACLWVASAVGVACGIGLYSVSVLVTVVAVGSLLLLKKVEGVLTRDAFSAVKVWSMDVEGQMERIENLLAGFDMKMLNACIEHDLEKQEIFLGFEIKITRRETGYRIVDRIVATPGVKKVRLE